MDFDNPDKAKAWLGLSNFDYSSHNDIIIEEEQIDCRCLLKINGSFEFVRGFVYGYCNEKEKYKFSYTNAEGAVKNLLVPRLYICLNT